jgi:hypothetical protein
MSLYDWMRRRETPLQRAAHAAATRMLRAQFPTIPVVHSVLATERRFRKGAWTSSLVRLWRHTAETVKDRR